MNIYQRAIILTLVIILLPLGLLEASNLQLFLLNSNVKDRQRLEQCSSFLVQQGNDSISAIGINPYKTKSPYVALFCSFVPGIIVHGSGHFYAGKTNTGYLLLGTEAAGLLLLYLGFEEALGGSSYQNDADIMGWTGLALFSGSWLYDVIGSPIAVQKQNQKLFKGENTELRFQPKDSGLRLVLVCHF
jgi:TM2 domain-containing membrane protein YozV